MTKGIALVLAAVVAILAATPALARSFSSVDRNDDGVVSVEEAERAYDGMSEIHILKCDRDNSGGITKNEFQCVPSIYQALYLDRF